MLSIILFLFINTESMILHHSNVTEYDFRQESETLPFERNEKLVLLQSYPSYVLIGARNHAYNLSLLTLRKSEVYEWTTSEFSRKSCESITLDSTECDNYIRTFFTISQNSFALCGTHGMHPTCAEFTLGKKEPLRRLEGAGMSPYNPDATGPFLQTDDHLLALNVPELSSSEPMLTRRSISSLARGHKNDVILRTPRGQDIFEQATFVNMFKNGQEVFSFFSETPRAGETPGLKKVARVARICADDPGGRLSYAKEWSSFRKGRLECAIEEDLQDTLFFNQLASISESSSQFYGAFRSQLAGIGASAICTYDRKAISSTLSAGLKYDQSMEKCPRASSLDQFMWVRQQPLTNSKISSKPLFVYHGKDRFVNLLVQEDVEDLAGNKYNILFIATNLGNIFKVVHSQGNPSFSRHAVTLHVLPSNTTVNAMRIYTKKISNEQLEHSLVIFSGNMVIKLPTSACRHAKTCTACLKMGDPECAWNDEKGECATVSRNTWSKKFLSQDSGTCRPEFEKTPVQNAPLQPPKTCNCEAPVKTSTCAYEVTQKEIRKSSTGDFFGEFPGIVPAFLLVSLGLFVGAMTNQLVGCCFQKVKTSMKKSPSPISSQELIDAYRHSNPMTSSMHSRPDYGIEPSMTTSSNKTYC